MAAQKNQGSQARSNGGAKPDPALRERVQEVADRFQDQAEHSAHRLQEGYESARGAAMRGYQQGMGSIAERPGTSVLVSFGIGFGVGLLLTAMMTRREEEWYEEYIPDSLRRLPERMRDLPDRLRDIELPEAVSRYLHR